MFYVGGGDISYYQMKMRFYLSCLVNNEGNISLCKSTTKIINNTNVLIEIFEA